MRSLALLFALFLGLAGSLNAQESEPSGWLKKLEKYKIQPSLGLQLWSSYTLGQKVYNTDSRAYEAVDDRINFQLRRTRIGLKGQPYEDLSFNFTVAIDLVGRDLLSGTEAGVNNGASPIFRLWNATVQWRMIPKSEKLNLVFGYMPPQIGRESITSAMRSNSMEKSWSQNYLRRHLTGIGPGRAMGANFGGLFYKEGNQLSMGYDLGFFTPQFESYGGNSVGNHFSVLSVGRLEFYLGDPESKKYTLGHKINYFGKRDGLTLALVGAHQGETDLFKNEAVGFDFLWNRQKHQFGR
ncbi:MAG: porin [Saprospiraceae bacterium]